MCTYVYVYADHSPPPRNPQHRTPFVACNITAEIGSAVAAPFNSCIRFLNWELRDGNSDPWVFVTPECPPVLLLRGLEIFNLIFDFEQIVWEALLEQILYL